MKAFAGKKILLLVENNNVPFDKRVWREAITLMENGADVSIIAPKTKKNNKSFEILENIKIYRYNAYFAEGSKLSYIKEYLSAIFGMLFLSKKLFLKNGFHIIHIANPPDLLWIVYLPFRLMGVKLIFDQHDLTPESFLSRFDMDETKKNGLFYKLLMLNEKITYRLSNAVIVTNESYRNIAIKRGRVKNENIFTVRNGPDMRKFHKVKENNKWKKGFTYMGAYIGIMGFQDGVDILIKTMDYLVHKKNRKDILFTLIGSGDEIDNLKQLTKKLNIEKYIEFTGRIPDEPAMEILSSADFCLSPDPRNPLNEISTMNKVMEYMVCEKPIVSFDLKEAKYSAQESAVYVKDSIEDFANGVLYLIENPEKAKEMGEKGLKRVEEFLRWEKQENNLIEVYKKLFNEKY